MFDVNNLGQMGAIEFAASLRQKLKEPADPACVALVEGSPKIQEAIVEITQFLIWREAALLGKQLAGQLNLPKGLEGKLEINLPSGKLRFLEATAPE